MTLAVLTLENRDFVIAAEGSALIWSAVSQSRESAEQAFASAATAESAAGPTYSSTAAGLAATSDGQAFAVDNGDGTVTVWLNSAGTAVSQRTLATTMALASPDGGELIGFEDRTVADALGDAMQYVNHDGRKFRLVECVLRNTGSGWAVIDDATHKNTGVASVEVDGFAIKINYDFVAKAVVSASSGPDEVFARAGVFTGASVGIYSSLIDICAPFTGFIDDTGASPTITTADFWNATIAKSGALITVSHPPLGGDATLLLTSYESRLSGVAAPGRDLVPTSVGSSSFAVGQKIPFAAAVRYDGSAWVITSALLASVQGLLSAAWSGNELVITHPAIGGGQPVQATSMNSAFRSVVSSISSTETRVQFVDNTGAVAAAPSSNMRVSISFPSVARAASFLQGSRFAFSRGVCRITPGNLVSASGNIWFRAILEVD